MCEPTDLKILVVAIPAVGAGDVLVPLVVEQALSAAVVAAAMAAWFFCDGHRPSVIRG